MNIFQAVFLGAIQGLAEFLPISSSGHLALAAYFFGQQDVPLLFDILLHLATLGAVVIVFRKRIGELFCVLGRFIVRKPGDGDGVDQKIILSLLVATVMTAIIGFSIKDFAKNFTPFYVSCCLVITGIILFFSSRYEAKKTIAAPGLVQGLLIGAAQGIGVFPGISRSGITISASLLSGVDRKASGEFSFLLSIPAILAAFILELKDADALSGSVSAIPLIAGMVSAFVVGYFSLKFLLGLINRGKLGWFAFYLVPVGISLAFYFAAAS